jgi:chromosome segregation ATPase
VSDDGEFGTAIHALLKELGWSRGELTSSLVHQALAQVRHLRKQASQLEQAKAIISDVLGALQAMTASRDEYRTLFKAAKVKVDELEAVKKQAQADLDHARAQLRDEQGRRAKLRIEIDRMKAERKAFEEAARGV